MNLKKLFLIGIALVLATACFAQGGGRRGMFGGGGMAGMLRRSDVQTDLALTDEQKAKLQTIQDGVRSQMQELFQGGGDRAEAMKQMQPIMKKASDDALAVLTPDQKHRLNEINVQLNGTSALIDNKDLQDQIGLSDDQKSKIADLVTTQRAANTAIGEKMRSQEIDREEGMAAMQKNQQALKDQIDKVLTDAQKAKLTAMGGKPFTKTDDEGGRPPLSLAS
jgi:Spy/CpxP family protein refolding chaperone